MAELAQLPRATRGAHARDRRSSPKHRYMAFLSYSHQDAETAEWLHEALEEFKVPHRLVGQLTEMGAVPKKLSPIFRDRHELAAAPELGEEIEEAIAGSRFLIVLCSRAAAKSRWIDEEIACFKRLHEADLILAVIIDGEPFASEVSGQEDEECFPPSMRVRFDHRGRPTGQRAEPIAADLRETGDGRRMTLLKIAAGMLGVGLDDLAQREAQRRHRRLYLITAASVAGMIFSAGLTYTAFDARDEAREQRREAESLIGFMLGDLREKLEPVGRLDVLDAVGVRALAYYEKQDKASLTDESLAQRSNALRLMGEMASSRGDLDGALRRYREALAGTAEALRRHPDDPQRMWDHAQSVYYVGETAMSRGNVDEAAKQFREYRRLAEGMMAADPDNPKWQLEGVYASSNLGIVELEQAKYDAAAATFRTSVTAMERLTAAEPANPEYRELMSEALAYYADALDKSGQLDQAIAHRRRQLALLAPYLAQPKPDAGLRQKAMIANMSLSRLLYESGQSRTAFDHAAQAVSIGRGLIALEPSNADWLGRFNNTMLNQANLLLRAGRSSEAGPVVQEACNTANMLVARDPTVVSWRDSARSCLRLQAEMASGDRAVQLARQVLGSVQLDEARGQNDRFALAQAQKLVGDMLWRSGRRQEAIAAWQAGLASWPRETSETPRLMAERGEMLRGIGKRADAQRITSELAAKGYRQSLSNRART